MHGKKVRITQVVAFLFCWTIVGVGSLAFAQSGTWTVKAPLPVPAAAGVAGALNGQLYILGNNYQPSNVFEAYNPVANVWTPKAPLPVFLGEYSAAVMNDLLYVIGGCINTDCNYTTNSIWVYDPAQDIWTSGMIFLPTLRYGAAVGVINGKLYVAGGLPYNGVSSITTLEVYDPVNRVWETKAPMPTGVRFPATGVIDGRLYVAGGDRLYPSYGVMVDALQVYDPATDTWTTKAPMPTATSNSAAGVINGKFYVAGGGCSWGGCAGTLYATVQVYDPVTDTWTMDTPLQTPMSNLAGDVINGVWYVAGGTDTTGLFLGTLEAFTPSGSSGQCSADLAAAQQQLQDLQYQVGTLTTQNQTLTGQNQSLATQVSGLQTQLTTLSTANSQLQNQVTSLGQQVQAVASGLGTLQQTLAQVFNSPQFTIPGDTTTQQMQNLVNAILGLNRGRSQGLYQNLGGK